MGSDNKEINLQTILLIYDIWFVQDNMQGTPFDTHNLIFPRHLILLHRSHSDELQCSSATLHL